MSPLTITVTVVPQFTVQYAGYIPVDHIDGPNPCPYKEPYNEIPLIYRGDANRGTYRVGEQITIAPNIAQASGFFPSTGLTKNYDALNSPVNGATLSAGDEDGVEYDCYLWNETGQADPSQFTVDETYPYNNEGQVHFSGAASDPLAGC